MAVVAHHEVVIHFECVLVRGLSVDENFSVSFFKLVIFIFADGFAVDGDIHGIELDCSAFLWNPERTEVVGIPAEAPVEWLTPFATA